MPVAWDELYEALIELCKIKNLKAAGISSVKSGVVTGAATVVGGLLLGRFGLLLGAAIAGGAVAALAQDCKPVWIVLRDLPQAKRQMLLTKLVNAFKNVGVQEVAAILIFLTQKEAFQSVAIKTVVNFLKDEYNLKVA